MSDLDSDFPMEVMQNALPYQEMREQSLVTIHDFRLELYVWDDDSFLKRNTGPDSYCVIPLTRGWFAIISKRDKKKIMTLPDGKLAHWHAEVKTDPETEAIVKVYAVRRGKARFGEPKTVYMHRLLTDCLKDPVMVVDHMNGIGLDNRLGTARRPVNLHVTSFSTNGHNSARVRSVNIGLLPGVEIRQKEPPLYGGIITRRLSHEKTVVTRSKMKWKSQEPAHAWYVRQLRKRNDGRQMWVFDPSSVNWPLMPPRWEVEPEPRRGKLSKRALERRFPRHVSQVDPDREVPF